MNQPRYNIFNQIHKALRAMLYETGTRIQQTVFTNREEGGVTIDGLEKILHYFDEHAGHEDLFILPAIQKFEPQLVAEFETEHVTDIALAARLKYYIQKWRGTEDDATLLQTGREILEDFNEFIAFNLVHMNKEEKILNGLLWQHYSDQEIMGIGHALVSSIPPEILMEESRWILRNLNYQEVTAFLAGLKHQAPEPVFNLYMAMAAEELPEQRWGIVKAALRKGELIHS